MRIRDRFKAIPDVLQRQILRRGLMGCAFLIFSMVFLLLRYDAFLVLPGFGFMLFSMTDAIWLFRMADKKQFVVVEGVCTEVVKSMLFKRIKTVTMEADGKTLRIQLKQYGRAIVVNMKLRFYIYEKTMIYEKDGMLIIYENLAIETRTE